MEACRVLVVEDDETARKQLAKAIQKEGYEVQVAEDGRAGVERFKEELPEIVITDLKMPGIDGLEVLSTVKRISPDVQTILVTAFGGTDTVVSALREGALDYLKKPLDLEQLSAALGRARGRIAECKKGASFPTILLAEDEGEIRQSLARLLEQKGWKVLAAADGEEAMRVFGETKIDIVILDHHMPKKDGLQVLHEMRGLSDDFEAIMLTGYSDETNVIKALQGRAMSFLKKPMDFDLIALSVEEAMEKLRANRAFRYRTRRPEQAEQFIGKITEENRLQIDLRHPRPEGKGGFVRQLLDALPIGLLVLGKDLTILYMNTHLARAVDDRPEKLDEQFFKRLGNIGVQDLSYESFLSAVNAITQSPRGSIETIRSGKYSFITLTPMTILKEEKEENTALIMIRGERR